MNGNVVLDRLAPRARPPGSPTMHQNWENLLFLHWPIDPSALRPLIPEPFDLDLFDGQAWIGITPFELTGLRIYPLPEVPGLNSFHELNVRTYVHFRGVPGVWFFSLDASKVIPAIAARVTYMLPYYKAVMGFEVNGNRFRFSSQRVAPSVAGFEAEWTSGPLLRDPDVESLAFFLAERYCLYVQTPEGLQRTRIYHPPWILQDATVHSYSSTMLAPVGLPDPTTMPLAHYSKKLEVEVWAPELL
jgi:uncharacterized protein YqjF (DUF2071 family)